MKKETIETLKDIANCEAQPPELGFDEAREILEYITNLQKDLANYVNVVLHDRKEIDRLQQINKDHQKTNGELMKLCNKYEEEHNTTFVKWQKAMMKKHKAVNYIKTNKLVDVDILLDILEEEEDE